MFCRALHAWDVDMHAYTQKQQLLMPLMISSYKVLISQRLTYILKFTFTNCFTQVNCKIWTSSETIHNKYERQNHK